MKLASANLGTAKLGLTFSFTFVTSLVAPALARADAVKPIAAPVAAQSASMAADDDDSDDGPESEGDETEVAADGSVDPESEAAAAAGAPTDNTLRYTTDLSDAELQRRFTKQIASLGSISVGFADAGRLINGVHMGHDAAWDLIVPENAWGTQETVDFVALAARTVHDMFPDVAPLRVNHIGKKDGGYLRPHKSHESGRDVDLGFYYKDNLNPGAVRGDRTRMIDPAPNWLLIRTILTQTDVQLILTDRKIQKVLYEYALEKGEDKAWLDRIFNANRGAIVQHARHHRDHFHVRFYAARSQELGRRIQPLLNQLPEGNVVIYRVHNGDTLGRIAKHYGSTVAMIEKANGMRNSFIHVGRTMTVPMRGACTHCPMPPPVILPTRLLPPERVITQAPPVVSGDDDETALVPKGATAVK